MLSIKNSANIYMIGEDLVWKPVKNDLNKNDNDENYD
jgi:hypothetical protein